MSTLQDFSWAITQTISCPRISLAVEMLTCSESASLDRWWWKQLAEDGEVPTTCRCQSENQMCGLQYDNCVSNSLALPGMPWGPASRQSGQNTLSNLKRPLASILCPVAKNPFFFSHFPHTIIKVDHGWGQLSNRVGNQKDRGRQIQTRDIESI